MTAQSAELLTGNGFAVLVDAADVEFLSQFLWNAYAPDKALPNAFYVMTGVYDRERRRTNTVWMHRLLLVAPAGLQVDHIDGNGLNNCRSNLRLCTQSQNNANARFKPGASGFRGVYKRKGRYRALISSGRREGAKMRYIGSFASAEDAARAYDRVAAEIYGEFATLNFPEVAA